MFLRSLLRPFIHTMTDEELMAAFRETGYERYYTALFDRHVHLVHAVCIKFVKDVELSRDLAMAVFVEAYQALQQQEIRNFSNWLFIAARNECISYLRKPQILTSQEPNWDFFNNEGSAFMENGEELRLKEEEQQETRIKAAIDKLGEEQRICITLFFFEQKSYKEISTLTSYTEKQVKSYLQNGKRQLRLSLKSMSTDENN